MIEVLRTSNYAMKTERNWTYPSRKQDMGWYGMYHISPFTTTEDDSLA
jgi:hypothetical protein